MKTVNNVSKPNNSILEALKLLISGSATPVAPKAIEVISVPTPKVVLSPEQMLAEIIAKYSATLTPVTPVATKSVSELFGVMTNPESTKETKSSAAKEIWRRRSPEQRKAILAKATATRRANIHAKAIERAAKYATPAPITTPVVDPTSELLKQLLALVSAKK